MKKKYYFIVCFVVILLTGCSKENQYGNYLEAKYSGTNRIGTADVFLNKKKLARELYNFEIEFSSLKDENDSGLFQFVNLY
ncbi:hypothetical protein [Streptococcus marmotae]|uniref:hypothetical protein n=1 Tax=Streptococcus marmotae TaxID=1825069 RepID=UPI00082EB85E|nr:hypothetical protein [Streptococcus marmotae]